MSTPKTDNASTSSDRQPQELSTDEHSASTDVVSSRPILKNLTLARGDKLSASVKQELLKDLGTPPGPSALKLGSSSSKLESNSAKLALIEDRQDTLSEATRSDRYVPRATVLQVSVAPSSDDADSSAPAGDERRDSRSISVVRTGAQSRLDEDEDESQL